MHVITFYDYGIEDIITGRKYSTLRFGENQFEEGSIVEVRRNSGESFGFIKIQKKTRLLFSQLTIQDAFLENWSSLSALKNRLLFTYPSIKHNSILTRYEFSYLPCFIHQRKRGSNADLTKYLPKNIYIITGSNSKANRYLHILSNLPLCFSGIHIKKRPTELEYFNELSAECRAVAKILCIKDKSSDRFYFSTDDMGLLESENRHYVIPNLRCIQNEYLPIIRGLAKLTIRTGIAISYKEKINTTIVYRSFYINPKTTFKPYNSFKDLPLNSILFIDEKKKYRVADLPIIHPFLINPLQKGIMDCFKGSAS